MEATTVRRDPRNAAELEKVFPGRLWVIARSAAEHGWDVSVQPTENGWALYLTEDHHCIHLFWKPNPRNDREQHPWTIVRPNLAARCPNGGRVHIRDIHWYLENHPDECETTHTRAPIVELTMPECGGHLPTQRKRDPLQAPIIATVDVVDVAQHAIAMYGSEEAARAAMPPGVEFLPNDYRFELTVYSSTTSYHRGATAADVAVDVARRAENED